MAKACVEDGCETGATRRGLCEKHYRYIKRHRGVEDYPMMRRGPRPPNATCPVCGKAFSTRGRHRKAKFCTRECAWESKKNGSIFPCHICGTEVYRCPNELAGNKNVYCSRRCQRRRAPRRSTDPECSFSSAHQRCSALWGSASKYPCVECGRQAKDWAYDGTDPAQLYGRGAAKTYLFYSPWPEFYMPLCRRCHRQKDGARVAQELFEYRTWKHETGLTLADIAIVKTINMEMK